MEIPPIKRQNCSPVTSTSRESSKYRDSSQFLSSWPSSPNKPRLARTNSRLLVPRSNLTYPQNPIRHNVVASSKGNTSGKRLRTSNESNSEKPRNEARSPPAVARSHKGSESRSALNGDSVSSLRASPPVQIAQETDQTVTGERFDVADQEKESNDGEQDSLLDTELGDPRTPSKSWRHEPQFNPDGEPRLPSTPTQLGLETPPSPPSGLYARSSLKRLKGVRQPPFKSSPLKPRILWPSTSAPAAGRASPNIVSKFISVEGQSLIPFEPKFKALESNISGTIVRHVTLSSPNGHLEIGLQVKTNKSGKRVIEMNLRKLSNWAEAELATRLRQLTNKMDLMSVRYTAAQYWDAVNSRADCWAACQKKMGHLSKRKVPTESDAAAVSESPSGSERASPGLTGLFGCQHILIAVHGMTILVEWRISFGEEGNIENKLSASGSCFDEWADSEGGMGCEMVEEVFDGLLQSGKSPIDALEILIQTTRDEGH